MRPAQASPELDGFQRWESVIASQIADLRPARGGDSGGRPALLLASTRPAARAGTTSSPGRSSSAPRKGPSEAGGRATPPVAELVPGKVAVAGPDDSLSFVDPREIDEPIVELPEIGWEQFADFLWAGQTCLYVRLTGDFSTSRCGLVRR